jgi:hypothetical protein
MELIKRWLRQLLANPQLLANLVGVRTRPRIGQHLPASPDAHSASEA